MAEMPKDIVIGWSDLPEIGTVRVRFARGVHLRLWLMRLLVRFTCWLAHAKYEESPE